MGNSVESREPVGKAGEATSAEALGPKSTEIELKLAVDRKALEDLRKSPIIDRLSIGKASVKRLTSVYYDTDEKRLARRGLSLRVRSDGQRFIQSVKAGGSNIGGLSKRGEWEVDVGSLEPKTELVPDPDVRAQIGLILPGGLKPIFKTEIRRHEIVAHEPQGDALVLMAFDSGEVHAENGSLPVSELELELLRGEPASLYFLALALLDVVPLSIEPRSKAARGYALASGKAPDWKKGKPVSLNRRETLEAAMSETFTRCAGHWTDNQAAALDGRHPEGMHQFRVGLRRFRSAITVFRRLLPGTQARWLGAEGRWTVQQTGPARDWDVFISDLLAPIIKARPGDEDLIMLRERAEAERAAGYAAARAMLDSERYNRFMLRLGVWLETRGWQDGLSARQQAALSKPIFAFAARLLNERHKRALKLGKGFAKLTTDQRHDVRIALKKLRYSSEFFATLFPGKLVTPYLESLRNMQNDLGHLNDVAMAERLLGGICAKDNDPRLARVCGLVIGWYARLVRENENASVRDWIAFRDSSVFWRKTGKAS
jgi:inorganic triphosphatase YgiF